MDPFLTIKALNIAMLVVIGAALFVFWRISKGRPFLLHWSLYEFILAAGIAVSGHLFESSLAIGIGVPILLLGILGYRRQRQPPLYAFVFLSLAIILPINGLAYLFGDKAGLVYLTTAIAVSYVAVVILFLKEGGALNYFIAVTFALRTASVLLHPLWVDSSFAHVGYAVGQMIFLCCGVGMLMAGFAKTYRELEMRELQLMSAYRDSEELMLRLERRNEEYLHARHSAEAASAAKTQFLANMSHELRTPLNAILGFSEMLGMLPREKLIEKATGYGRNIHDAATGLLVTISDILNLSRVEAGALEIQPEICDLDKLFADIRCLMQPLADQKSISLIHRSEAPCLAHCDHRLTRQALINGVSNAIKYTERGGTVICSTAVEGDWAAATVEDNGVGIDESRLGKVFEPFWQEGNSFVAENTGVGLGLSIAKSYVEAQKGRIELKPAAQRGTVFRISLPRPAAQASGDARQSAAS